jgi:hypothetical protein
MVDWDEDGLKDLLVGQFNGRISYYRNIGMPGHPRLTFVEYLQVDGRPIIGDYDSVPFVDDWDEDGRKDLLMGTMDGRIWLYINEGTNAQPIFNQTQFVTLANGATLRVPSRSAPCVTDLDGDGFEDLVVGQINGHAGFFRSCDENPSPLLEAEVTLTMGSELPLSPGPFSRFAALDWDGDGRMDLLGGPQDGQVKLFRQIAPGPLPPPPYLEVNFQGPAIVPDTGAVLNFTCMLENPWIDTLSLDVWADLFAPGGRTFMGLQSAQFRMPPGGWIAHEFQWTVPAGAPYGFYQCWIYAGDQERLQVCAADTFEFQKALLDRGIRD